MYGVIKNTELGIQLKNFLDKLTDSEFINYSSAFIFKQGSMQVFLHIVDIYFFKFIFSSKSSTLYFQINNIINFCKLKNIDLNTRYFYFCIKYLLSCKIFKKALKNSPH